MLVWFACLNPMGWLLLPLFFFAGCPCCGASCDLCSDAFTRADDTDISTGSACGWTETAGSWSIVSNTLQTASDDALALSSTSGADELISISVSIKSTTNSSHLRVILDYQDASNYHFADFQIGTGSKIELFKRTAGVNNSLGSVLITASINTAYTVVVCFNTTGYLAASFNNNASSLAKFTTAFGAGGFALGTGALLTGTATFDTLVVTSSDTSIDCGGCQGNCTTRCLNHGPDTLTVVWANIADTASCTNCTGLNGTWVCVRDIGIAPCSSLAASCFWKYPTGVTLTGAVCNNRCMVIGLSPAATPPNATGQALLSNINPDWSILAVSTNGIDNLDCSEPWDAFGAPVKQGLQLNLCDITTATVDV